MIKIIQILIIFGVFCIITLTGCDKTVQNKPDDITADTTLEAGKTNIPEGINSEITLIPEETGNNSDTLLTEQSSESNASLSTDAIPEAEIELDKVYFNERFKFELKYPDIWSLVEEEKDSSELHHGAYIFIDNSNICELESINILKIDHINIYGVDVPVTIPSSGTTIGEFITDDGLKATTYLKNREGWIDCQYVFEETDGLSYYIARVYAKENVYEKYKDVISNIIKSINLNDK